MLNLIIMRPLWFTTLATALIIFVGGTSASLGFRNLTRQSLDPLPSWEDGPIKEKVLAFIRHADNPTHPGFIPKPDRIATLDLDGTLIVEQPHQIQVEFALSLLRDQASRKSSLKQQQPWKAALENDETYIRENMSEVLLRSVEGMSLADYRKKSEHFLRREKHPRYGIAYQDLLYKPTIELINYLRERDFMIYLVTGTQTEFIRALQANALKSIYPNEVIGSRVAVEFQADGPHFIQSSYFREPDNWLTGKAENIRAHLGRGPVFVMGNSIADYEMFIYADKSPYPSLCLVINHDDDSREYAYADEDLLELARKHDWTILNISQDWKRLFSRN